MVEQQQIRRKHNMAFSPPPHKLEVWPLRPCRSLPRSVTAVASRIGRQKIILTLFEGTFKIPEALLPDDWWPLLNLLRGKTWWRWQICTLRCQQICTFVQKQICTSPWNCWSKEILEVWHENFASQCKTLLTDASIMADLLTSAKLPQPANMTPHLSHWHKQIYVIGDTFLQWADIWNLSEPVYIPIWCKIMSFC